MYANTYNIYIYIYLLCTPHCAHPLKCGGVQSLHHRVHTSLFTLPCSQIRVHTRLLFLSCCCVCDLLLLLHQVRWGEISAWLGPKFQPPCSHLPVHRRCIYKGDTRTHAQGTDPRVALGPPCSHLPVHTRFAGARSRLRLAPSSSGSWATCSSRLPSPPTWAPSPSPFGAKRSLAGRNSATKSTCQCALWPLQDIRLLQRLLCTNQPFFHSSCLPALPTLVQYYFTINPSGVRRSPDGRNSATKSTCQCAL